MKGRTRHSTIVRGKKDQLRHYVIANNSGSVYLWCSYETPRRRQDYAWLNHDTRCKVTCLACIAEWIRDT